MIWVIIVIVVAVFVVRAMSRGGTQGTSPSGRPHSGNRQRTFYAKVFIYNGEFCSAVYLCDPSYYVSQIVVVNYKGQEYAGRIVDIDNRRPEDIPEGVSFKSIIRPFRKSDMSKVAYWNDSIDKAVKT